VLNPVFLNKRMKVTSACLLSLFVLAMTLRPGPLPAQADDVADVPSQDLRAGGDANKGFFLIGPRKGAREPRRGFGLVAVLPGGPGGADFNRFVKLIYKQAVPDGYLVAQPVAVRWTEKQFIVWPTEKVPAAKMRFTTEEFVAAVIKDVAARHKVDPRKVFTLSWSSSGRAGYALSLTDKAVAGTFVAMSVFKPKELPPLEKAKGHPYYLYHSREDEVCPFRMAQQAARELKKNGAAVKLQTYKGKHGWNAGLGHIREGIVWLEKNAAAAGGKK
jgi:predicted esterase